MIIVECEAFVVGCLTLTGVYSLTGEEIIAIKDKIHTQHKDITINFHQDGVDLVKNTIPRTVFCEGEHFTIENIQYAKCRFMAYIDSRAIEAIKEAVEHIHPVTKTI